MMIVYGSLIYITLPKSAWHDKYNKNNETLA